MTTRAALSFRAPLGDYLEQAEVLLAALEAQDEAAEWRVKWTHPRFRGRRVADVRAATLDLEDAKLVVALEHAFASWADLAAFTDAVARDGPVAAFERAADAVVAGDLDTLRAMLGARAVLVAERSTRRHRATLLHYVAANGVEGARQRTPANAVEVASLLLDAGADANALADMYDRECATMSLLVSSSHPAEAGLQVALANVLLDHGAAIDGVGAGGQSAIRTALAFGFLDTARALAARGGPVADLAAAAGLGLRDDAERLLPSADRTQRRIALSLAAQHGHAQIVQLLLDAGADPDAYNPEGFHAHSTPLHQAALAGHAGVVRALVERGARLDVKDTIHDATPLGWALHGERGAIAEYLRERSAPR
jgi:ankyrin repeat protein